MIVACIRGRAEPHATKVLIHPAIDALSPRHGLARIRRQDGAAGGGIERQGAIAISEVCAKGAGRGDHGCNTHVASDRRDQVMRKHIGGGGRRCLLMLVVLEAACGRT